jgi:hypothetical protein
MVISIIDESIQECHRLKKRLPSELINIKLLDDGETIAASLFEYPEGCRWWDKFQLKDLPDNLISAEDLIRFRINLIH